MAGRWRDGIQSGLRSAQPAASAVAIGALYFVTDEGVMERSTGSAWVEVAINETAHDALDHTGLTGVGGGSSLNMAIYKRTSGAYTTTSASLVDVDATNLALGLTTGANRVEIGLVGSAESDAASAVLTFDVLVDAALEGGGTYGLMTIRPEATASYRGNVSFTWITGALSAAAHTFKLQWKTSGGTATLHGNSSTGQVMQFWVKELV